MKKRADYFYMRMEEGEKDELRRIAEAQFMGMSAYIRHLISKDKEQTHDTSKTNS
jgi:hypothetical protein